MKFEYMEANNATFGNMAQVLLVSSTANEWIGNFYRTEEDSGDFGTRYEVFLPLDLAGVFLPNVLPDLIKRLNEIFTLPDNWDGRETAAPNYQAYSHAWQLIEILSEMDFAPAKLVPSAEEGIGIFFAKENRYGFVECSNEGEIVVAMSDRQGHRRVWQISDTEDEIKEALETLRGFINRGFINAA
jgi:hypothetical protein